MTASDRPRDAGALLFVLLVALALRLARLCATPFWFNEAYTGLQTFADPARLLQAVRAEVTPPLYYLVIRAWAAILGHGEWSLRLFSVLAGTLAAGAVFAAARRVSRAAGLAAGLIVAVTPLFVHYSREARMYPLLVCLLAGAIACLLGALEGDGRRARVWTGYVALGAASIWTHTLAVLALAAAPVAALAWGRRSARNALLATLAAGALALPLAPWVIDQARLPATGHVDRIWSAIPPALAIPRSLELFAPGALYPPYPNFRMAPPPWRPANWLLLAALLLPGLAACRRPPGIERRVGRAALAFLALPLGLLWVISLARPVYLLGRYDLLALPGFAILAGLGFARLALPARALAAVAGAVLATISLAPVYRPAPAEQSIARGVALRLLPSLEEGDVLLFTGFGMPAVRYALLLHGRDPAFVTLPASTARHAGWVDLRGLRDPAGLRREIPRAARAAADSAEQGRVWLVEDLREPGGAEVRSVLQGMGFRPALEVDLSAPVPGRWSQPLRAVLLLRGPRRVEKRPKVGYNPSMRSTKYLLIGGGLSSFQAAKEIREGDPEGSILLVGDEPHLPYDRPPLSKEFVRGDKAREGLAYEPESFYREKRIDLALGRLVRTLDPAAKTATLADGEMISFQKALVATGGRPVRLDLPGMGLPGVHVLRTVEDSAAIAADARSGRSAVLAGGGFIGLELAASLTQRGVRVTVIETQPRIWSRFADVRLADHVQAYCEARGVAFVTGDAVTEIEGNDVIHCVYTRGGKQIHCDFVCIGVGILPNVELARDAGLAVDGGIVVDDRMRTSHPDIHAAGDVVSFPDPIFGRRRRVEHWGHAEHTGQIAGRNMAGGQDAYDLVTYVWSDIFDLHLEFAGDESEPDETILRGRLDENAFTQLYLKDGRLRAYFAINGNAKDFPVLQRLIRQRKDLSDRKAALGDPEFALRGLL